MTSESEGRDPIEPDAAAHDESRREAYVPPAVEDIDTSYGPTEAAPGVSITNGAEDSVRWH